GRDAAALEQDPLALSARVVARLAVDRIALAGALETRLVHRAGDRRHELPVLPLAGEERLVLFQLADRDRAWHRRAHRRAVVEEGAGSLRQHLRLVVHARIGMNRRAARKGGAGEGPEGGARPGD